MIIYGQEISDGLAEKIEGSSSIAYHSTIKSVDPFTVDWEKVSARLTDKQRAETQPDLFYFEDILVSTGWNLNDDIFLPEELWNARYSPVNKQVNYMHNERDIIGHIVSVKAVDFNGAPIDDNIIEIPQQFELYTQSVLYKWWEDETLVERMNHLIANITDWYNSMECWFNNFDYGLIGPDNNHKIIARNKETSFLSKFLRIYGGEGKYNDYKIGRVIRNLTFSGKGIVNQPANPRSVIISGSHFNFFGAKANLREIPMSVNVEEFTTLKVENESLKSQAKVANDKVASLETDNKQLKSDLEVTKATVQSKDAKINELNGLVTKANESIAKLDKELNEVKLTAKKDKRLADLTDTNIEAEKRVALVDKFIDASDEIWTAHVEALKSVKPAGSTSAGANLNEAKPGNSAPQVPTSTGDDVSENNVAKLRAWIEADVLKNKKESK